MNGFVVCLKLGFPGGSVVKNLPAVAGASALRLHSRQVRSLSQEVPLEEGKGTHPSILAWRIPGTEEPYKLQSRGSQSRT